MDIQGAEYRVIQGMSGLLRSNPHATVVTEFSPARLDQSGISPQEYLDLLTKSGFEISEIAEREKKIKPVEIPELLKSYTVKKKNMTNLLCRKKN